MGRGEKRQVFIILCVLCCFLWADKVYAGEGSEDRVLFISSYSLEWDTVPLQIQGIQSALAEDTILNYEFMNTKIIEDEKSQELFLQTITHLIENTEPYDVIITGDDAAFQFAYEHKDDLFKDIPIVFQGVNNISYAIEAGKNDRITGVVEKLSYPVNLESAMSLCPDAREIVGLVDDTITGEGEKEQFFANEKDYPDYHFRTINSSEFTKEEFIEQLAALDSNSICFYLVCSEDRDGNRYSNPEVIRYIRQYCKIPVFRMVPVGIGTGVLGGHIVSHEQGGRIAGTMAQEILDGREPAEIEVVTESPNTFYYDYQVMKKFGITKEQISKDAIVVNEDISFLNKHAEQIVKILLTAIIVLLLVVMIVMTIYIRERNKLIRNVNNRNEQLKLAVEQAKLANEAKSAFLAKMSHEIRTPMNAIIGITELSKNKIREPEKIDDNLSKIEYSARMLLGLIDDILDMSAIESNKMKIASNYFDIRKIIDSLTSVYYPLCKNKGINYSVSIEKLEKEILIGDQMRLTQILNNLLSNAFKFTEEGGSIKITLRQKQVIGDKVYLELIVADTGQGMSESMLSRLFKPFEQESKDTALHYGGSGLGLSIVKNLVELMHGKISADSKKGEGTTFKVSIAFGFDTNKEVMLDNVNFDEMKALVVDDDWDTCQYISSVLKRLSIDNFCTQSGEEALKELERASKQGEVYNLCFLDWKMPEMNGVELTKRMKALYKDRMSVIIVSAYDLSEVQDEADRAGVDMLVTKPVFQSTVFNLLLELSAGKAGRSQIEEKEAASYDFTGRRVLLAEDNELNRDIAVELLAMTGLDIDCAVNGEEAVEKFKNMEPYTYDAILMDIQMPIYDGYEATRMIRKCKREDASVIPIIAMTANAFMEDVAEALDAGMNAHISKPIDTNKLYETLQSFFKSEN